LIHSRSTDCVAQPCTELALEMLNDRNFTAAYGRMEEVTPLIRRIVAKNPGPYTFWGTGTYVIGHGKVAIIDPGPAIKAHIAAILAALAGETISHILITHTHTDHSPAAMPIREATGARTYGFGPHRHIGDTGEAGADLAFTPDVAVGDGDSFEGPGWRLSALHTPGHTSNHLCYALPQESALFTGDHVMGWSTTVIAPPDGNMADYMRSLDRQASRDDEIYWPTHGGSIRNPKAHLAELIEHRMTRRRSILASLGRQPIKPAEIVRRIYTDLDPRLVAAAAQSVRAHLIELAENGLAEEIDGTWIGK
jgi:glyoxylase-like metal-dependent hydrolase (beta-lactamase superfamily II)